MRRATLLLASLFACIVVACLSAVAWEVAEDCGGAANLLGVAFATPEKGVAVGEAEERIVFSVDGGITWQPAKADMDLSKSSFFDALFTGSQTGWAVGFHQFGDAGRRKVCLLKSADAGASWTTQPISGEVTDCNAFRLWFDREGNGWILPYSGPALYRTTDQGRSWQKYPFYEAHPSLKARQGGRHMGWHVFNAEHVMIGCEAGLLVETRDAGATWTALDTRCADYILNDVFFVGDKNGWAVGDKGLILHTSDGGKTWEKQMSGVTNNLERIAFADEKTGYAVGPAVYAGAATARYFGALLCTRDGGKTWKNINPTSASLRGLCVLDAEHAWAAGGRGGSGSEPKVMIVREVKE